MQSKKLYVLQTLPKGQVIEINLDTRDVRIVIDNMNSHPDGIALDKAAGRIYWTNMGEVKEQDSLEFFQADGSLESCLFDGSARKKILGNGLFVTGKQLLHDAETQSLYWCDREGMRVFRADQDGNNIQVLVQRGLFPRDSRDYTRHCVGIALDKKNGMIYWTEKGPSKGGQGKILRAALTLPDNQSAENRQDIDVVMDNLPEPIDLELDDKNNIMYWTDRGDSKIGGNTLNCADIANGKFINHRILAAGLDEGIALALDEDNRAIYLTDLGGNIYKHQLDNPGSLEKLFTFGPLTGLAIV